MHGAVRLGLDVAILLSFIAVADQMHPEASDENPGTAQRPFRTIGRAAEILRPGPPSLFPGDNPFALENASAADVAIMP